MNQTNPNEQSSPPAEAKTKASIKPKKTKQRQLTNKQRAFVQELISNPRATKTSAYIKVYAPATTNKATIHPNASRLASNKQVRSLLAQHSNRVEQVLMGTVDQWGESDNTRQREIAMDTAKFVHDKIHGKAKQSVEVQSTSVNISIDLSGDSDDEA